MSVGPRNPQVFPLLNNHLPHYAITITIVSIIITNIIIIIVSIVPSSSSAASIVKACLRDLGTPSSYAHADRQTTMSMVEFRYTAAWRPIASSPVLEDQV